MGHTSQPGPRSFRSRVLWGVGLLYLIVMTLALSWQLAVRPSLWDVIVNGANY